MVAEGISSPDSVDVVLSDADHSTIIPEIIG